MIRSSLCICAVLGALALPSGTSATDITFTFSGEVVGYLNGSASTMIAMPLGTPISGFYSFDPNTPDINPSIQDGEYVGAVTALNATVGGGPGVLLAAAGVRDISVFDDSFLGQDGYFVLADVEGMPAGIAMRRIGINLLPGSTTAFSSDALPLTPPSLSDFPNTFESQLVLEQGQSNESVLFNIVSLALIPEPSTFTLLSVGLACISVLRRA